MKRTSIHLAGVCILLALSSALTVIQAGDSTAAERHVAAAVRFQQDGKRAEAIAEFTASLNGLDDAERRAMVQRTLGHLYIDQAREVDDVSERNALQDRAAKQYFAAGEAGDLIARRHYLAAECARSAERGYEAGWQFMTWNGMLAVDGWLAVFGNYGATVTAGKGIPGLLDQHPAHAVVWGIIVLGLVIMAFAFSKRPQPGYGSRMRTPIPGSAKRNTPLPVGTAKQRTPIPGPVRRPSSPAIQAKPPSDRTPRPTGKPPSHRTVRPEVTASPTPRPALRTPQPGLEHLRAKHLTPRPEKAETASYVDAPVRRLGERDETDADDEALVRKPAARRDREETEADGNKILPPKPAELPRRPR